MATTITITAKTPTSISATITKTSTAGGVFAVGPGTTWDYIVNHAVQTTTFGNGQSGTFNLTLTGLSPNTQYGAVAGIIGGGDSEISNVVDGTLPVQAPTSITVEGVTENYASFKANLVADGGYYTKALQCSIDGGTTWVTRATTSSSTAVTLNFTSSQNLTPGTDYTMLTRMSTSAGVTNGPTVHFATSGGARKKVYGSVNGFTERLGTLYGGSNNGAVRINKLYGSVNGQSKLIYQDFGHLTYT